MKKPSIIFILAAFSLGAFVLFFIGCASTNTTILAKSGAQLWGENCIRCHNAPSPDAFNDDQWQTIGLHMRVRANLTQEEIEKIVSFLQMAN